MLRKDRTESFEACKQQKQTELDNPQRTIPRGILFSEIRDLQYKIELTKKSLDQLQSDHAFIEKEIEELKTPAESYPPYFCGTATVMHRVEKEKQLTMLKDEIEFRQPNAKSLKLSPSF